MKHFDVCMYFERYVCVKKCVMNTNQEIDYEIDVEVLRKTKRGKCKDRKITYND